MPNHVINRVVFDCSAEKMKEILSAICYDENAEVEQTGLGTVDFNKITPMPASLDIESGSSTTTAINLYLTSINPMVSYYGKEKMEGNSFVELVNRLNKQRMIFGMKPNMTLDEIKSSTEYRSEESLLSLGKSAVDNLIKYGSTTWYDWCTREDTWNTKWNSYNSSTYDGGNEICFQTAWSAPHPVIEKLSSMYPEVGINHSFANEDLFQSCGSRTYLAGEMVEEELPETERECVEMSASIWDYDLAEIGLALNASQTSYISVNYGDYELVELEGQPALFTNGRLTNADIPDGLHLYHLRHSDDGSRFCTLEKQVLVNHGGSIVTSEPIDLGEKGFIEFTDETSPNFLGENLTFAQYMEGDFETKEDFDIG